MNTIHTCRSGIYVASKTIHAQRWRAWRACGAPICSTWIDEAGEGETCSYSDLWLRCIREAAEASVLVAYHATGEVWKGAYVEIGAALGAGKSVIVIGDPPGTFVSHPLIRQFDNLYRAMGAAQATADNDGQVGY